MALEASQPPAQETRTHERDSQRALTYQLAGQGHQTVLYRPRAQLVKEEAPHALPAQVAPMPQRVVQRPWSQVRAPPALVRHLLAQTDHIAANALRATLARAVIWGPPAQVANTLPSILVVVLRQLLVALHLQRNSTKSHSADLAINWVFSHRLLAKQHVRCSQQTECGVQRPVLAPRVLVILLPPQQQEHLVPVNKLQQATIQQAAFKQT